MALDRPVQAIIGEAPVFLEMLEHVSRAAPLSKPVLVVGPPLVIRERDGGKQAPTHRDYAFRLVATNSASVSMFLKFVPLMSRRSTLI